MPSSDSHASAPAVFAGWHYDYATSRWNFETELLELLDTGSHDVHDIEPLYAAMPEDDRQRCRGLIDHALSTRTSFAGQFRLQTQHRGMVTLALVGDTVLDEAGEPLRLKGYSTDVTDDVRLATRAAVDAATRHRRAIEQVKGALMVTYRIDEVTAFALLRQQSNAHNVKLNLLAEHVARAMGGGAREGQVPMMELMEGVAKRLAATRADVPPAQVAT